MHQIKEYSFVEEALNELAIQYLEIPDASTLEGYKSCKAGAKVVGKYRIDLEAKRKEIKGPALEKCKAIDEEAKRIQAAIFDIENPLKIAYKAIDEEKKRIEEIRIANITEKIDGMTVFIDMARTGSSEDISEWIEQVDDIDCSDGFDELTKEAITEKNKVLEALQIELRRSIQQKADDKQRKEQEAELEELRELKAERDAEAEKQRKIEQEKENQTRLMGQQKQADLAAKEAEERRIKDVEEAKESARKNELERQEMEKQAELGRLAKLESDKKHVGKVRGEIKDHLMQHCNLDEKTAKSVVLALLKINRITINY